MATTPRRVGTRRPDTRDAEERYGVGLDRPLELQAGPTRSGHRVRESSTLGRTAWRRNAGKGIRRPTLGEGPAVSIRPLIIRGPRRQVHLNPRGSIGWKARLVTASSAMSGAGVRRDLRWHRAELDARFTDVLILRGTSEHGTQLIDPLELVRDKDEIGVLFPGVLS